MKYKDYNETSERFRVHCDVRIYLANRIQQPIPKLRILNFFPEIRCVFLSGESGF